MEITKLNLGCVNNFCIKFFFRQLSVHRRNFLVRLFPYELYDKLINLEISEKIQILEQCVIENSLFQLANSFVEKMPLLKL